MSDRTLTIYTTGRCSDCQATKMALDRLGVPYEEVNIEEDPDAAAYVVETNGGRRSVPTLAFGDDAASLSNFDRRRLDAFLDRHDLR